jgi:predicted ATPase/DNA-binding SARP family transcriptional activator
MDAERHDDAARPRVDVLGPVRATVGGEPVSLGTPKQRLALAVLVAADGRVVTLDGMIDALWPDAPPKRARHSVQQYTSRLRGVLDPDRARGAPSDVLASTGGGYRLVVSTDLADLTVSLATARRAFADGRPAAAVEAFEQAEALWRGPAYADLTGAPFADTEARRLEGMRLAAVEERLTAQLAIGAGAGLTAELEGLTADHPYRERLWTLLVTALHAAGRRADALDAYDRARTTLVEELGLDPGAELRAAQQAVLDGDRPTGAGSTPDGVTAAAVGAPTSVAEPGRSPIPPPRYRTSLVGRQAVLGRLASLLVPRAVVTLTGVGGAGKTRLATEVAGRVGDGFRDGVAFVALAPVTDAASVDTAFLEAVGLQPRADRTPVEVLLAGVVGLELLLVVDNAEHVLGRTAELVDQIAVAAQDSTVLTTSRQPLGVPGEQVVPIGPLDGGGEGAVELLLQRARLANPDIRRDDALVTLARRLDGIPLAIEMVAPWTRTMATADIVANLDEVLTITTPSQDERRSTMAAAIRWSEELLAAEDRESFARLGVLAGDWDLDAAAAVLGTSSPATTIAVLGRLVDASLVEVDTEGTTRYRMLEPVRQYAIGRLAEAGEERTVRDLHADHFAAIARRVRLATSTDSQLDLFVVADRERPNLRAAHEWSVATGDVDRAAAIVGDLVWWWLTRRHSPDEVIDRAMRVLALEPSGRQRVRILLALTQSLTFKNAAEEAAARGEQALEAATDVGDNRLAGAAAVIALRAIANAGDHHRAEALLDEARTRFRAAGSSRGEADVLLAEVQHLDRDLSTCARLMARARELAGDAQSYIGATADFADALLLLAAERFEEAARLGQRSADLQARAGTEGTLRISALNTVTQARVLAGDVAGARPPLLEALDGQLRIANPFGHWGCAIAAATYAVAAGAPDVAARAIGVAEAARAGYVGNRHLLDDTALDDVREDATAVLGAERVAVLVGEGRQRHDIAWLRDLVLAVQAD